MKFALVVISAVILLSSHVAAQSFLAFGPRPGAELASPALADQDIAALVSTLDRLLATVPAGTKWSDRAGDALWHFARRIQAGRLTRVQETRVLAHLDGIARSRPEAPALVAGPKKLISTLAVGKLAPEITGRDLEGKVFKLSDYRNRVVLLKFAAEWCAICRTQAPYERFMLEKYARWPFTILGVETGSSRETARQAHLTGPVTHRSWWDEPLAPDAGGPIAAAWSVTGWPATYLIDGEGVIQYVDLRDESLLIAVRQLVEAQADRDLKSQRTKR